MLHLKLTRLFQPSNEKTRKVLPPIPTKPAVPLMKVKDELTSNSLYVSKKSETVETAVNQNTTADDHASNPASVPSVFGYVPYTPLEAVSEFRRNPAYNGGTRGSTRDKRRYFEMIANKQLQNPPSSTDHLLDRKIELGGVTGLSSDSATVLSGYDSVGPEFILNQSTTATEGSSCDVTEEDWSQDCLPPKGWPYENVSNIQSSIEKNVEVNGTFKPENNTSSQQSQQQSQHRMPTRYDTPSVIPPPPAPHPSSNATAPVEQPPVTASSSMNMTAKWQVKTEGQNEEPATGSVEIPKRQSVATLREQIANKLEVKSPTSIEAAYPQMSSTTLRNGDSKPKSAPTSPDQPTASTRSPNTESSESAKPSFFNNAARGLYQIVHEPMKRHISRITPVPFCKPTISFSSLNMSSYDDSTFTQPHYNGNVPEKGNLASNSGVDKETFSDRSKRAASEFTIRPTVHVNNIVPSYATLSRSREFNNVQLNNTPIPEKLASKTEFDKDTSILQANEPSCSSDYNFKIQSSGNSEFAQKKNDAISREAVEETAKNAPRLQEAEHNAVSSSGETAGHHTTGDLRQLNNQLNATESAKQTEFVSGMTETETSSHNTEKNRNYRPVSLPTSIQTNEKASKQHEVGNWSSFKDTLLNQNQPKASSSKNDYSETSLWYKEIFKRMHKIPEKDQSILKYRMREITSPYKETPRAFTPTFRSESRPESRLEYECLPRRSKSVGRYANDSSPTHDENIVARWREERTRLSSQDHSHVSASPIPLASPGSRYGTCSSKPSTSSYNNNRFLLERSKTVHFHLPSYRFRDEDSRPIASWSANCMRCGRPKKELSWREIEYLYETLGKPGVHLETINEELLKRTSASGISERLELASEQIHRFVDELKCRHPQYPQSPEAFILLNSNSVTNQLTDCRFPVPQETKKLTKEEIMNKKRVEKLSEELEEQRNRRHGYVPSASPSLQKNFDRLNGLLNNFGREERCTTPKRIPAVATCTAIYTFKAQNSRELSFSRGDVIRIHRTIDANWIQGERNGQIGIFPSSYVQIDEYLPYEQKRVVVLYPFYARNKNELTLKKGELVRYRRTVDANWIEGVNTKGEIGIFPKTYVQDYEPEIDSAPSSDGQIPDRPKTPKLVSPAFREESQIPLTKVSHQSDVQAWQRRHISQGLSGLANIVPKNSETYRALYAYIPKNSDELELQENDIVFVVEKCDDGWYIGTSLRTSQFGTFPGNYVERH